MKNLILLSICLILAIPCQARVITVNDDGPADFNNIQAGINDANDGDTVIVSPGTYTGPGNRDIDFLGKAITVRSTEPNDANIVAATIIDCNGTESEPHRGLYFHNGEDSNSIVSGLTITNGYGPSESLGYLVLSVGGGIFCNGSSPTITNCRITNNIGHKDGGGICCYKSSPKVTNCNIIGNEAEAGGGIFCSEKSKPTITNCTINNNSAGFLGGGLYGGDGPIHKCTISKNSTYCGGGVANSDGPISNCSITDNSATENGGGIYFGLGPLTNCTISGNSAGGTGGGIYGSYSPTINSCIIWGNKAEDEDEIDIFYPDITLSYCNVNGCGGSENWQWNPKWDGGGNIDQNPFFVNPAVGDYHLSPNSICINSGNPSYSGIGETDIDGQPRVMDGRVDIGADEAPVTVPIIRIVPAEFEFDANEGGPHPEQQILYVSYIGAGIINWQVTEDCPWLEVAPPDGQSVSGVIEVILDINVTGLDPCTYNCEFTVTADGVGGSPQTAKVVLHVLGEVVNVPGDFPTIQDAIDHVQEGGTVIVEPGLYLEPDGREEINFLGKNITLTSIDPTNRDIVNNTVIRGSVQFSGTENPNCKFTGFKIQDERYGAIYGNQTHATISHCILNRNGPCYGTVIQGCDGLISNCEITDNFTLWLCGVWPAIDECHGLIKNCTIANNVSGVGVWRGGTTTIQNCIIYHNYEDPYSQLGVWAEGTLNISYCDVQGGQDAIYMEDPCNCTINWGPGNIDIDPCFVRLGYMDSNGTPDDWRDDFWVEGDYHLRENSPCIDAGDPKYIPEQNEMDLDGNPRIMGDTIDMGAYEYKLPVEAEMKLTPQTLNCKSKGNFVKAHCTFPEGILPEDIDVNTPVEAYPMQIVSEYITILGSDKGPVRLEILFNREAFCSAVPDTNDGYLNITVLGSLTTSQYFQATDTIKIINDHPPRRGR